MFGRCTRSISRVLAALLAVLLSSMASNPVGAQPVRSTAVPTEVLGWSPGVSGHLPPGATITLYFNRPMNRSSVERAWSITPSLPGSFAWHGAALMFHPKHALKSGVRYRLSVAPAARAADGISLQGRYAISFSAGDALRVQSYSPYRGTRSVPVNGVIAITFNHPMVTLAGLNAPPRHPAGWRTAVSPHTAGYGSWLGTSTWVFRPSSGLRPATRYTISLAGSARDAWGQSLGHPFTWSFRTVTPEVYSRSPRPGTRFVDPHGRVHITFNQPMDHASVARAFSLQSGGVAIAGGLTWSGLTATFRPLGTLDASSPYVATVGSSARSANGLATLGKAVHWNFRAAPRPKIVSTMPAEGHTTYNFPFPRYGYFPGYQPEPYSVGILFNTPMNQKSLDKHLTIQPAIQRLQTYFSGPNNQGHFTYGIAGDFSPSAQYTITVGPGIRDRFDRPLPGGLTFHFKTSRLAPSVSLYGAGGGFGAISATAGKIVHAPIQFLNVPSVRYTLIRTTLGAISASGCCGGDPAGPVVRRWGVTLADPLDKVQNLSAALKQKDGSPLIPGIYWLRADAPDSIKGLAPGSNPPFATEEVIVTNVNLTLKSAANETLVWANSTVTGNPLAGVRVKLVNYQGNSVASGTTGTSGIHIFKRSSNQGQYSAMVSDRIHFGLAGANWSPNIFFPQPASFTNAYYGGYSGYGCCYYNSGGNYLYTDRPVYRPGQMVHFRGLLWRDTDSVYSLYGAKQAKIYATDQMGKWLYHATVTLDRFGGVHGSFRLPSGTPTGNDSIDISIPHVAGANTQFTVADYRKPEFLSTVKAEKSAYIQGQILHATTNVKYVFGAPASHQHVQWSAYAQPSFTPPPGWDAYSFYNWDVLWQQFQQVQLQLQNSSQPKSDLGIRVGHGAGSSGARGNLPISLPIDLTKLKLDQTITLESTTTDTSNQSVSSRATINAYRSALAIGLAAEKDVVPAGQQVSVQVAAVQHDGKPFAGASLIATIAKRTYTSKLVPGVNGSAAWRAVPHDTVIDTQTLAPDASGKASVSFTPADGGDYVVTVSGKDSAGNHTSNEVSIYASAAGFSDFGATNDTSLTLKPDKSTYAVGDTAHVLVAAPFASENALITVERGNIRKHWVQRLTSNSSTVDVPVTIDDLPNVYVTVTLYRGAQGSAPPDWRYGAVELHVQVAPRHLIIHVAQTGSRHHPRDRVTYTVKTTDAHGRPVSAQLSLALVDSAVLALQPETNADILQAYYAEQPLAVSTTSDAILSIDHLQVTPDFRISPSGAAIKAQHGAASYDAAVPAPVLAGGGGGGGEPPPAITVRSHFADTAYWSGALTTNAAGRASITLALPDNATTWRLDVRGVTGNQAVGQAHLSTLATQDIVLRPVTPRFLEQGGSLKLGAVLNNTLSHAITARVTLSASGISIGLAPPRLVTVPAKGQRLMLWPARVGIVKSAQVLLRAVPTSTNVRGDAVRIRLPVYKPLTDETVATAGQVYGSTRQLVMVPLHAATSPGALTVQVSASITAGLGAAFGQFQPRQNESNDDVANRVLAAASLRHLPASITGLRASTYRRLPQIVAAGVQKLMDDQYGDGGWPWFNGPYEFSDFQVSLDVLQALAASGEHGPLVRQSIARGRQYLKGQQNLSTADRAQSLLVLAQTGGYPRFRAELLYGSSPQQLHLSPAPLGDLGLALADVKDRSHARSIVAALDGKAVVSATGAHWEGNAWDPWSQPAIEETARVLATLVALSPHDPFVPAAARWLMLARQGAGWDSPHDSAQAIAALALYGRAAREGHAAYSYRVAVNGHARLSGNYAGSRQTGVGNARVPVAQLRRNHVSTIDIGRHANGGSFGTGPLYYVTRLKYYLPANRISPRNEGLSVSRRYLNLAGKPINHVAAGSPMQVQLTVHTSQTLLHLDIEDPIPVGCEPIDPSLATSQQGLFRPPVFYPQGRTLNLAWYLIHSDLRDNRVSLYSYSLPPGTYRYTYLAQATVPRSYGVPPTHAAETFFPEVFGRSAGQEFTVTR